MKLSVDQDMVRFAVVNLTFVETQGPYPGCSGKLTRQLRLSPC